MSAVDSEFARVLRERREWFELWEKMRAERDVLARELRAIVAHAEDVVRENPSDFLRLENHCYRLRDGLPYGPTPPAEGVGKT